MESVAERKPKRSNRLSLAKLAYDQTEELIVASGEPFLQHALRPLHTIFRRIGWIYHSWLRASEGLDQTIQCHLAILDAVAGQRVTEAVAASDVLIAFSDSMFEVIEKEIDPALLDCNLALETVRS